MKKLCLILLLVASSAHAGGYTWSKQDGSVTRSFQKVAEAGSGAKAPAVAPEVEGLKERMIGDSGIMDLITALQSDPEMQKILNDPATMSAVQSGNIAELLNNPAFMKLLSNPRVQEIQKMLQEGGAR